MKPKLKGHLLALFSCCVWGSTFISSKVLLTELEPLVILMIRFTLGLGVLFLLCPKPMPYQGVKRELQLAGAGLCGISIYYVLENTSLLYATASLVSVIICTAPFFVALCSWVFLKTEKPKVTFFIGFVVSIAGVALLSFTNGATENSGFLGILMAVIAAAAWGFYSVFTKKAEAFGYNTVQVTQRIFIYGILFMLPTLLLSSKPFDPAVLLLPRMWLNLLFLGVVASALCFVTWNEAMKHLGTLASSVYIYLTPVVTVAFSVPILHESLSLQGVIGIVLTLAGVVLSER